MLLFFGHLKFAGKVKTYFLEILLCHLQNVCRVGHENVSPFAVFGHVLEFSFFEQFEGIFFVAFYPARFVKRKRFEAALCPVFVQKSVLNHFKLKLPYGADNFSVVVFADEKLSHALVHQLRDAFFELLGFHRVGVFDVTEHFGRKARQAFEMDILAFVQCVPDFESTIVGQSYDVAGKSFVNGLFFFEP